MRRDRLRRMLFGSALLGEGRAVNAVYALFRVYIGLSMCLEAGLAKVYHKVDESAPASWANARLGIDPWFADQVAEIGFRWPSPVVWASMAAWGELVGGFLIAVGLLTRLSGLQLAFQFFVVAFVWYKAPVPFLGMYYQQLLFWGYCVVAAFGGGRYALDRIVAGRLDRPVG